MSKWEDEDYSPLDAIDMDFLVYLEKDIPEEMWEDLLKMNAKEANKATRHLPSGKISLPKKKASKKKSAKKGE